MTQYAERTAQPQAIELAPRPVIHATLRQAEKFFAMTSDWGGGALRVDGALMKISSISGRAREHSQTRVVEPAP